MAGPLWSTPVDSGRRPVAASIHFAWFGASPQEGAMETVDVPPAPGPERAGQPRELRRGAVGFGGILFQSITFMAPAIATAFSIPIGMSFGGGATPLAVIIAMVASLFVASSIAQLAKHMPSAGSFYTYVSNSIHPGLRFLVGWAFELAL